MSIRPITRDDRIAAVERIVARDNWYASLKAQACTVPQKLKTPSGHSAEEQWEQPPLSPADDGVDPDPQPQEDRLSPERSTSKPLLRLGRFVLYVTK